MTVSRNEDGIATWESDAYPLGTVATDEDDTDPSDRADDFADEGEDEVYVHHYEEDGKP